LVLDGLDLTSITAEKMLVVFFQFSLEVLSQKNSLELSQELKRVSDILDNFEVLINVSLKISFNHGDSNVEFDEVSIEGVALIFKKSVALLFESFLVFIKGVGDLLNVLEVVHLKSLELMNGAEQLNKLVNSSAEEIKLSEDLVGIELELLAFWHVHESLLGEFILLLIGSIKFKAALKHWDQLLWWIVFAVPKAFFR